jgi:hypothetical protein
VIEAGVAGGSAAHHADQRRTVAARLAAEAEWLDSVAADERDTAAQLQQLSTAHSILHDLKLEEVQGNIDHLVIGPGGAFVVVTRRFAEQVSVRGEALFVGERSLQAELEGITTVAGRLTQHLATPVVPVIGFHGGVLPAAAPQQVVGVYIAAVENLARVITRASHTLLAPHKVSEAAERVLPLLFNPGSVPRTQVEQATAAAAAPVAPWIPDPVRPGGEPVARSEGLPLLGQVVGGSPAPAVAPATAPAAAEDRTPAASPFSALGETTTPAATASSGGPGQPTSLTELSQMANSLAAARATAVAEAGTSAGVDQRSRRDKLAPQGKPDKPGKPGKPDKPGKPGKQAKPSGKGKSSNKGAKSNDQSRRRLVLLVVALCVVAIGGGAAIAVMQNRANDEQSAGDGGGPTFTRPSSTTAVTSTTTAGPMADGVAAPAVSFTAQCITPGAGWDWIADWPGDLPNLQFYDVEVQNPDGSWSPLAPLTSSAVTAVSVGGQPPGTTITLRITAVMADGSRSVNQAVAFTSPASPC